MSVLIKGMEMPESCARCSFAGFGGNRSELKVCMFSGHSQPASSPNRMENCTLVEVPSPHGRLIDAEKLMQEFEKAQKSMEQHGREFSFSFISSSQEISTEWYCVELFLDDAPTVIEAEG